MPYTYPQIPTNTPENTDAVPAREYGLWLITNLSCRIQYVEDPDKPGELKLQGSFVTEGRKYQDGTDIVNPIGEKTVYREIDIIQLLERATSFADAYDAFVTISALLLEQVEAQDDLIASGGDEFEAALMILRQIYWELGDFDSATAVTICIINYPQNWNETECLIFLGLILPGPTPPPELEEVEDDDGNITMVMPEPKKLEATPEQLAQAEAQLKTMKKRQRV